MKTSKIFLNNLTNFLRTKQIKKMKTLKIFLVTAALIPLAFWTGCKDNVMDPFGGQNFAGQKQNYTTDSPVRHPAVKMPVIVPPAPDSPVHNPPVKMPLIVPPAPDSPVHNPPVKMPLVVLPVAF
jgi:hypothetical protein